MEYNLSQVTITDATRSGEKRRTENHDINYDKFNSLDVRTKMLLLKDISSHFLLKLEKNILTCEKLLDNHRTYLHLLLKSLEPSQYNLIHKLDKLNNDSNSNISNKLKLCDRKLIFEIFIEWKSILLEKYGESLKDRYFQLNGIINPKFALFLNENKYFYSYHPSVDTINKIHIVGYKNKNIFYNELMNIYDKSCEDISSQVKLNVSYSMLTPEDDDVDLNSPLCDESWCFKS